MADRKLDKSLRPNINPSDIVQQTLIQMVNGIANFRGSTSTEFYGWLNQIIKHEAVKAGRNFKRKKRDVRRQRSVDDRCSEGKTIDEPADYNPTPGTNAISNERRHGAFPSALERLPTDYAEIIRLRSLEQLPFKEIADKMHRSVDSVSKLWYRAVVKFQQELELLDDNTRH